MAPDFSISLQGYARALEAMDRAARRIAAPASTPVTDDSFESGRPAGSTIDYAAEIVTIRREKTAAEANLKALELQSELADETLKLLGPD